VLSVCRLSIFMHKISTMKTSSNGGVAESPTPLSEQAFRSLRHDVLVGTFEAGSKLKLDELQGHYGFSSSPLREALSRLTQALRSAIELGDDAWEGTIVAAFHRLEKVESRLSDGPVILDEEWSEVHRNFHSALVAACASERQRMWSASLFDQAERYRRFSARHRQVGRRKSNEHRKIMDAALRRDADTACALLGEHIMSTQRNVEAAMRRAAGT
jgi:DNA-binding GntR family transcriptional regulator